MLSKEMLNEWKIRVEVDPNEKCGYSVYHTAVKAGPRKNGKLVEKKLTVSKIYGKHKYATDLDYYAVSFCTGTGIKTITLQRLVYVYFVDDIPDGYEIDHINCDRLDNSLDNLRCLTIRENRINKRKQHNKWTYLKEKALC